MKLVLASKSPARQALLANAGIEAEAVAANVDEESLRDAGVAEGVSGLDMATALAEAKAKKVSMMDGYGEAFVIGGDQLCECDDGSWLGKPASRGEAVEMLEKLQGRIHKLITVGVVFQGGRRLWHHGEIPKVGIRKLDSGEIKTYLDGIPDDELTSSGVYRIEGRGARIISRIDGCHYSVLGLPLLQLLAFLREHGVERGS